MAEIEIPPALKEEFEKFCEEKKLSEKQKEDKLAKLKETIKRASYDPGEAIGVIAAQSISEPATQMSIDAKEKVIIKHNDVIAVPEIGTFVDKTIEAIGTVADDWEVADVSSQSIFVPSITKDEKIAWKRVLAVSRHAAPKNLLKISTASGRKIIATDSHSFVIRKDNKITPIAGCALKAGDRIPSVRYLPENCIDAIEVKQFADPKGMRRPLPERLLLTENLGWLFGIYLAEGNCTPNYVSISNVDENIINQLKGFAQEHGFSMNEYDNFRGFSKGHDTRINATHLSLLLSSSCGRGSKNKTIPLFAYSANEKFVSGLLRGYFDGDGNVSVPRCAIRISSNSNELINGVALLLTRFGIFASKGTGKQFTLSIPHKYAKLFRERIGFSVKGKSARLDSLCRLSSAQTVSWDFLDMINGFGSVLKDAAQKLGYPTRYINNFTNRQKIGRSTLIRYITIFESLSKEKSIDIQKELFLMKRMAFSDVVWDEIENITAVLPTSRWVYDFSVEEAETFTTFDGIITHNTMRSYTLASQSDRLSKVTQGLPRLIEIFDVRKTFERNMIIYLEDSHNSKEGAKKIVEKIKESDVKDIITEDSINLVNMEIELDFSSKDDRDEVKNVLSKHLKKNEIFAKENKIIIKPEKNDIEELRRMLKKLLEYHVLGIKDIIQVVIVKEGNDWIVQTSGSNLKKVLELDGVDKKRTMTNDINQTAEVLGIEAARNLIINETRKTLSEQGLEVDMRHIILLADIMTVDGEEKAIGRYGVSGEKGSVLARANFEETKKHLVDASFYGERDILESVIENVMIGQMAPIGTGLVQLGIDKEKLLKTIKKKPAEDKK